jgi:hypothetical protein
MRTRTLLFSASLLAGSFLIPIGSTFAQAPDNTAVNQRDRAPESLTPMDQSNKPSDLKMTQEIRRAIVKDDQLSTDAEDSRERKAAKEIFDRAHADDVSSTGEARV